MRKIKNIDAKNKVEKQREMAVLSTKKNRKQLFAKSYCSEKKLKNNRVGLELLMQSFEDKNARLVPDRETIFSA